MAAPLTLVQAGSLVAVNSAIQRSAHENIKAQLATAARVFDRLIDARNRRLVEASRILSEDFPFKQVVALDDRATLLSAMDNHRLRIRADLMMLVDLDGKEIIAMTLRRDSGATGPVLMAEISRLVEAARQGDQVADVLVLDDHA